MSSVMYSVLRMPISVTFPRCRYFNALATHTAHRRTLAHSGPADMQEPVALDRSETLSLAIGRIR